MRSKSRPGTTLEQDLNPTWWWDTLEKTVSGRQKVQISRAAVEEALSRHSGESEHFDLLTTHAGHHCSRAEPTDAPTDLRVSKVHSSSVLVHWKPVDLNSVRGEFKEYRVSPACSSITAPQLLPSQDTVCFP